MIKNKILILTIYIVSGAFLYAQDPVNLIAYYPFNGNCKDSSQNNKDGKVFGAILTKDITGKPNGAYYFSGDQAYIQIESEVIDSLKSFTVSCWIAPKSADKWESWISKSNFHNRYSQWRFGFGYDYETQWGLTTWDNKWNDYWINNSIELSVWTHVVMVLNEFDKKASYYKNGELIAEIDGIELGKDSFDPFFIGFQRDDNVFYHGNIDEIKIYNGILSENEINQIYSEFSNNTSIPYYPLTSYSESTYSYNKPVSINDGIEVAHVNDLKVDTTSIYKMLLAIQNGNYKNINSVLINYNDKLFVEEYYFGFDINTLHPLYSVTKSFSSTLIGIAIDNDLINSVNEPLINFFPEYSSSFKSDKINEIELEHLLTMTTGVEWNDNSHKETRQMHKSSDWYKYVFNQPIKYSPGVRFVYNNGTSHLISNIIKKCSNKPVDKFTEQHLFNKLHIDYYYWAHDPLGNPCTGGSLGGLFLRPRDMLKFGLLIKNGGEWQGESIISKQWINKATNKHIKLRNYLGYGYQWWIKPYYANGKRVNSVYAEGYGGQFIIIIPDYDLVAVFTSRNDNNGLQHQPLELMQKYILKAINNE